MSEFLKNYFSQKTKFLVKQIEESFEMLCIFIFIFIFQNAIFKFNLLFSTHVVKLLLGYGIILVEVGLT
jgi:hypothetical protein